MKLILALPAIGLLFSGLTTIPKLSHHATPALPEMSIPELPEVWIEKNNVFQDESFELHFAMPHATSLGMIDPDGHFFYLVFPAACTTSNLQPLISSEAFSQCSTLTICPATLKADPYTYGVMENQPVFTKSGVYKFILGDDLHVDDESALNIVSVRYKHKKRTQPGKMIRN